MNPPAPRDYYISIAQQEVILLKIQAETTSGKLLWAHSEENNSDVYEARFGDGFSCLAQLICSRSGDPILVLFKKDIRVQLDPGNDSIIPLQIYNYLRSAKEREFVTEVISYFANDVVE